MLFNAAGDLHCRYILQTQESVFQFLIHIIADFIQIAAVGIKAELDAGRDKILHLQHLRLHHVAWETASGFVGAVLHIELGLVEIDTPFKTDNDLAKTFHASAFDFIHAVDGAQLFLQRFGNLLFHLFRADAWVGNRHNEGGSHKFRPE